MQTEEKTAKPKKRHTGLAVFLCVLLALLAVLGGIAWRYRAGIRVVLDNFGKTPEQASAELADYEMRTQALLDKLSGGGVTLSALSDADRERLKKGEITPAEAVAIIMGLAASTDAAATDAPDASTAPDASDVPAVTDASAVSTVPGEPAASAATNEPVPAATTSPAVTVATVSPAVQQIIADIYLLRAEYINKLDLLIEEGKKEVYAIPNEKRTLTVKLDLMNRYLARGEALEAECDARLEALLDGMEAQLRADGSDTSLADEARALYAQEKKLYRDALYRKYLGM